MHVPAAGESAAQLPWLWPDALSLAIIAQPHSPAAWPILSHDPGALLFIHRNQSADPLSSRASRLARPLEPRLLNTALHWWQHDRGRWLDWRRPLVLPIYQAALAVAHHARILAELTQLCDPRTAWTAGLLAPLGWFAVAACDPSLTARCLADPDFAKNPLATQRRLWGLDHAAIARRLAARWRLPDWLAIRDCDNAERGSLPDEYSNLSVVVKLAILLAEREGYGLRMGIAPEESGTLSRLQIGPADLLVARDRFRLIDLGEAFERDWSDPRCDEGLPARLQGALDRCRAEAAPFVEPLEHDLDRMHRELVGLRANEDERLRQEKLEALAEFAGGASHEINNPLAVIRGQSQYVLNRTADEASRKALESIVRQTQRIHSILAELMQFARPPRIEPHRVCLLETINSTVEQYRGHADEARVELACTATDSSIFVEGDPRQLQTAIGGLVRNAIEAAAPGKGWVRVGLAVNRDRADVQVEDSGTGPTPAQRKHLFDPFYSGRAAGRGRGLGLPIAWRLAREHGGDVRHDPTAGGPTRFVLSLPLAGSVAERLSA